MKTLPARRYHKTPRPWWGDAYTLNGFCFESKEATETSEYYATFRKFPVMEEPLYTVGDKRIVFAGLQTLCDLLFYDPITHAEIDEALSFLKERKATSSGFS